MSQRKYNVYNDKIISDEHRLIYKISLFVALFFIVSFVILTIINPTLYSFIISHILGSFGSIILFYYINKIIIETDTYYLKKAIKKIHIIYKIIYFILFVILMIIFRNWYVVVGLTTGLLTIRLSIIISNLFMNHKIKKE